MTNTKVLWITIWLTNFVTSKKIFPLLVLYSRKILTMSPISLNLVKNAHLKLQNAIHVKLFFKGCPVPQWFRQGTDCRLTRKTMLENFPVYLRNYADNHSSIFEELLQYRFTKKPIYSANIIRYSLLLRYTSIQSYKVFKIFRYCLYHYCKRSVVALSMLLNVQMRCV